MVLWHDFWDGFPPKLKYFLRISLIVGLTCRQTGHSRCRWSGISSRKVNSSIVNVSGAEEDNALIAWPMFKWVWLIILVGVVSSQKNFANSLFLFASQKLRSLSEKHPVSKKVWLIVWTEQMAKKVLSLSLLLDAICVHCFVFYSLSSIMECTCLYLD